MGWTVRKLILTQGAAKLLGEGIWTGLTGVCCWDGGAGSVVGPYVVRQPAVVVLWLFAFEGVVAEAYW